MKTVKINFVGYYDNFDYHGYLPFKVLKKHYNVQVVDDPDYVFCNIFDNYSYCNFNGIRIYGGNEYYSPDFNIFDYAITYDNIQFGDRHLTFPFVLNTNGLDLLSNRETILDKNVMNEKSKFCNYIYGHMGNKERLDIYQVISKYKVVDSAGKYLNNMGGVTPGDRNSVTGLSNSPKIEFQRDYKFTIAFENLSHPGYITEKLYHAFMARTIPIYYGDPLVGLTFNKKAFINCHDFNSFEEVLDKVKEVDENDSLYLDMINQPIFNNSSYLQEKNEELEKFILNIFEQNYERAFRRAKIYRPKMHEQNLIKLDNILRKKKPFKILMRIAGYFKRKIARHLT